MTNHALETCHQLVRTHDPSGLVALLAEDAVFYSPVVHTTQRGRRLAACYLGAAFQPMNTMTPLFKKLNLADLRVILVLNAPDSFEPELQALEGVQVNRTVRDKVRFALAFVKTRKDVEIAAGLLTRASEGDALLWMAYPKGSSKKYKCEFNRDTGWQALGEAGYEPVRQVAIDEDWSALRFRKVEFIRTMNRNPEGAISSDGRRKARAQRKA